MLAFDRRLAARAWTVSLVLIGLYLVFAVRRTIFVFVLALLLAYMLAPLVRWVVRWAPPRLSRIAAIAIVFVALAILLAIVLAIAGPHVTEQAGRFADELPTLLQDKNIADRLPLPAWLSPYAGRLIQLLRDHLADGGGAAAAPVAKGVGRFVLAAGGGLVLVVLLPILAFLMLVSGPSLRERFLAWTRPHRHGGMWRHIVSDLDVLLGGYIRALVILAIATTLSYSIALSLFGLPYSLLLAASGGALEFVPVLGPLTAALSIVGVAVLGGYGDVLWIAAFIAAYRVFQDYILNPFLMNKSVAVPALLVLFGLLAGEELAGVAGVFLATPLLAAALILVRRVSQEQAGGETAIQTSD